MSEFRFEEKGIVFGQVLSVALSEEREGDWGPYRRIEIMVQPVNETDTRIISLPEPRGWPNTAHRRSMAMEYLRRAAAVVEAVKAASTVRGAFQCLQGLFLRFEEQSFELFDGTERYYLVPTGSYKGREECLKAWQQEVGSSSVEGEQIPPEVVSEARAVWMALAESIPDEKARQETFKKLDLGWPDRAALLRAVQEEEIPF